MSVISLFFRYFPLQISPFVWFSGFLQFFYIFQVASYPNLGGINFSPTYLGMCVLSIFTVMLFFQILNLIFGFSRWAMVGASLFGLTAFDLAVAYHFRVGELFNWSILSDNSEIAVSWEALQVMWNSLDKGALLYLLIFGGAFIVFEFKYKAISKGRQVRPHLVKFLTAFGLYLSLCLSQTDTCDPLLMFFKSIRFHYTAINVNKILPPGIYPFWRPGSEIVSRGFKQRPKYIFLIVVESLNASAIDQKNESGVPWTPFMNALQYQSLYYPNFYGNSIQTAKGHFALYFSGIPSLSGKVFVKFPKIKMDSVATYLKSSGYDTHYFIAQASLEFDNEYEFLTQRGFDDFRSVDPMLSADERANKFLWGVEDSVFFEHFFKDFDSNMAKGIYDKPQFFVLVTVANHSPFKPIPKSKRFLYPNPGDLDVKAHYANSVRLTDDGLRVFFKALKLRGLMKDSLIIITGDHGFPLGDHHIFNPEAGYFEDSFHPPLFVIWEGHIVPKHVYTARSQLDIAPTILDCADASPTMTHFLGHSLFLDSKIKPIYLVQPYGKHFSVVIYPYKYRFHAKLQKEYIYDLSKDPQEMVNLISSISPTLLKRFRLERQRMYLHQAALIQNQIKP